MLDGSNWLWVDLDLYSHGHGLVTIGKSVCIVIVLGKIIFFYTHLVLFRLEVYHSVGMMAP